jgi:hypothetical protein
MKINIAVAPIIPEKKMNPALKDPAWERVFLCLSG